MNPHTKPLDQYSVYSERLGQEMRVRPQFTNCPASLFFGSPLFRPLDALGGIVKYVGDLLEQLLVPAIGGDPVAQSRHEVADGAADFRPLAVPAGLAMAFEPLDQLLDLLFILFEMGATFLGRFI